MDSKINDNQSSFTAQFYSLKEEINKLVAQIETDMISSRNLYELKEQQINNIEAKFVEKIEKAYKEGKETEKRLLSYIDETHINLKSELNKEKEVREQSIQYLNSCVNNDIPKLHEMINQETKEAEISQQNLYSNLNEKTSSLIDQINANKIK